MIDAPEISSRLAARIEELAVHLFPAGKRAGGEFVVGGLTGEPGRSTSICLRGAKRGVWADFASGEAGDALDLVRLAICGGDMRQAIVWAVRWLGLSDGDAAMPARPAAAKDLPPADTAPAARRTAFALNVFLAARSTLAGSPVDAYLQARGIDLRALGRQPRALRFHPALYNAERNAELPGMVAAISGPDGAMMALHRTWLEQRGGVWRKAALERPKMVLGSFSGGAIRLWRGSDGVALATAPAGSEAVLAEGIETGLSIAMACRERRVLAAVSIGNMAAVILPSQIETVIIAADNDAPGSQASKALQAAIDAFTGQGRRVLVARSPVGSDFNDALQAETA